MHSADQKDKDQPSPTQSCHPLIQDPNQRTITDCIDILNRTSNYIEYREHLCVSNGELTEAAADGFYWSQRFAWSAIKHVSAILTNLEARSNDQSDKSAANDLKLLNIFDAVEDHPTDEYDAINEAQYFLDKATEAIFTNEELQGSVDWSLACSGLIQWQKWLRLRHERIRRLLVSKSENATEEPGIKDD